MANRIAFSWNGLPYYAAEQLRAAIEILSESCGVIGSSPSVPVTGMETALGQDIVWVDSSRPTSWEKVGLAIPDLFFQSGWAYPAFSALGSEVKQAGGTVVGLSDANWRGDFRQLVLGSAAFRLVHRRRFDAFLVPGEEGARLLRFFGFPENRIYRGMYGATPRLFSGGPPLRSREKQFLYVGQFIDRKDVIGLTRAFLKFAEDRNDWILRLVGSGELRDRLPQHPQIIITDFVQAEELAYHYRRSRFFVLPSKIEAWGLVVHEAALAGCGLILSDRIGSAADLAGPDNSIRFAAGNENEILLALHRAANFSDEELNFAEVESRNIAKNFGPQRFAYEVRRIVDRLSPSMASAALKNNSGD